MAKFISVHCIAATIKWHYLELVKEFWLRVQVKYSRNPGRRVEWHLPHKNVHLKLYLHLIFTNSMDSYIIDLVFEFWILSKKSGFKIVYQGLVQNQFLSSKISWTSDLNDKMNQISHLRVKNVVPHFTCQGRKLFKKLYLVILVKWLMIQLSFDKIDG